MKNLLLQMALCLYFSSSLFGVQAPDIEKKFPCDFITHLQKIDIPGHPYAFNPSIVRWNGVLLMNFREIIEPCKGINSAGDSYNFVVWLNDDFKPISKVYQLDMGQSPSFAEDSRLVVVGNELYIVYSHNTDAIIADCGFRMWTAKLVFNGDKFIVYDKERITYYDGEDATRREKNWVPFDYYGHLCLSYSLSPHIVFLPIPDTQSCLTVGESDPKINWKWGELRGGTPAIAIKDRYLGFFHSCLDMSSSHSDGKKITHYFMGAYTFNRHPPFEITHVSPNPIVTKGFYSGKKYDPYWKPVQAVFPCGLLVEEDQIWVTFGRQDHEIWITKIDLNRLLNSLEPVGY